VKSEAFWLLDVIAARDRRDPQRAHLRFRAGGEVEQPVRAAQLYGGEAAKVVEDVFHALCLQAERRAVREGTPCVGQREVGCELVAGDEKA
jgi:hypothetical protein